MITQEQIDQLIALIEAGEFDQASEFLREEWPELWLALAQSILVRGSKPVHLEDLAISESWNLHLQAAEDFGASATHLFGIPTVDQDSVVLPVTTLFLPTEGYRFLIVNGSTTNRLTVDPDGAATIDGAGTLDVEPLGSLELVFEGITGREFRVVASSSVERIDRIPLVVAGTPAGMIAWQNPFGVPVLVRIVLDITTASTGASTADFGQAATAVVSDNLIDQVDLGTAPGVFSSHDDQGTNGRTYRRVGVDEFVTGSKFSGAVSGLVGTAFIHYRIA